MTSTPPPGTPEPDRLDVAWRVVRSAGPADDFHHLDPEPGGEHQLWIHTTPGPALILGSTQPDDLLRHDRAAADGIEVGRRRSGGGLVYLDPGTDCWIDAIVPAGSPLWEADVGRAFHWIGQRWAAALNQVLGPTGPALVHRPGPRTAGPTRPLWCFAGLGHGEVTIGASKVVGLSQRRTKEWVRLQSLVLGHWPGRHLLPYVDIEVARDLIDAGPAGERDQRRIAHLQQHDHLPDAIDPSKVRAGPPPGLRLPGPEHLAAAFLEQARRRAGDGDTDDPS